MIQALRTHLEAYVRDLAERDLSRKTPPTYRSHIVLCLNWLEQEGRPLDGPALLAYRDHLAERGKRPRTINAWRSCLICFFRFLEEEGLARDLAAAGYPLPDPRLLKRPRIDRPQRYCPTDEEVRALFAAAAGMSRRNSWKRFLRSRARAALALFCFAGLRRAELLALDTADLIRHPAGWRVRVRQGKGGQYREVPLNQECRELLVEWLEIRSAWCRDHEPDFPGLFPVDARRRMSHHSLEALLDDLLEAAGLAELELTPHCLRKWFVTRAAAAQDIPTAAALAGHANIKTTLDHYLATDDRRMQEAVDGLPAVTEAAESGPPPEWAQARNPEAPRRGRLLRRGPTRAAD